MATLVVLLLFTTLVAARKSCTHRGDVHYCGNAEECCAWGCCEEGYNCCNNASECCRNSSAAIWGSILALVIICVIIGCIVYFCCIRKPAPRPVQTVVQYDQFGNPIPVQYDQYGNPMQQMQQFDQFGNPIPMQPVRAQPMGGQPVVYAQQQPQQSGVYPPPQQTGAYPPQQQQQGYGQQQPVGYQQTPAQSASSQQQPAKV
jgi:hypothetical protein